MLLEVQRADILAQSDYQREEKLHALGVVESIYQEILKKEQCLSIKGLAIGGRELVADGMKPGREIGLVLEELLNQVLEEPERNTRDYLLEYSRKLRMDKGLQE